LSGAGKEKFMIKETGLWLKQKGYQGSLIIGPKKYFRLSFYAQSDFLNLPDSWEKVTETIKQKKVIFVVTDPSTIEQDCPEFMKNWERSGLVLLQEIKGKSAAERIQIYLVPR